MPPAVTSGQCFLPAVDLREHDYPTRPGIAPLGDLVRKFGGCVVPQGSNRHSNESHSILRDHQRSIQKCFFWYRLSEQTPVLPRYYRFSEGFHTSGCVRRVRRNAAESNYFGNK